MFEKINRVSHWKQFLNENIIEWYEKNKGIGDNVTRPNDGIIYHFTNNLEKILIENTLNIGDWGYVSFTRNSKLNYGKYRICLDFDKLNNDYELKNYVYDGGWDCELEGDELENVINNIRKEEEIIAFTQIKNLDRYIINNEKI